MQMRVCLGARARAGVVGRSRMRAASPPVRVHECPQSRRRRRSAGAQFHPQTLTSCNLRRGNGTRTKHFGFGSRALSGPRELLISPTSWRFLSVLVFVAIRRRSCVFIYDCFVKFVTIVFFFYFNLIFYVCSSVSLTPTLT